MVHLWYVKCILLSDSFDLELLNIVSIVTHVLLFCLVETMHAVLFLQHFCYKDMQVLNFLKTRTSCQVMPAVVTDFTVAYSVHPPSRSIAHVDVSYVFCNIWFSFYVCGLEKNRTFLDSAV